MRNQPRERSMPFVPEPFDHVTTSRESVNWGEYANSPMAKDFCRFCPTMDTKEYLQTLSEEKGSEVIKRGLKLRKRAAINCTYKSSEFSWEVCAWGDVFGLILDDEGMRMDKRPYEFIGKDDNNASVVKTKIPDATMGLKSYGEFFLKRGSTCDDPNCSKDHSAKQPDERLSKRKLIAMMGNPKCGLIVDGVWGETDLIFPFAVYEAKKRARSFEAAEEQIYHACSTYLAMLDDLTRNPDNMVETLWEGDVTQPENAIQLICIVDQIHEYATNEHRPFVMNHLEAWHERHKRTAKTVALHDQAALLGLLSTEDLHSESDEDETSSVDHLKSDDMESLIDLEPDMDQPEWARLKKESKMARNKKAQQTRARNREVQATTSRVQELAQTLEPKRPRGCPPKAGVHKQKAPKRPQSTPSKMAKRTAMKEVKESFSRITRSMTKSKR
ncbi:hypothetical protein G7Z17_g2048 [Cylindrodendrum hubeiense]|uniref:Uncharacterized protein n=1 Tax=Cylindrodendrum hubeiense TaxID=595255 RepID=A0A9P5HDK0_9HYPO|nr:hypothetical protein G7Z17_g2048 [Cylindrodendrum hubeiense]